MQKEDFIDDPTLTAMLCAGDQLTERDVEDIIFRAEDIVAHLRAMPPLCTTEQFEQVRRWVFQKIDLLKDHVNTNLEFVGVDKVRDLEIERYQRFLKMMKDNPPPAFHPAA